MEDEINFPKFAYRAILRGLSENQFSIIFYKEKEFVFLFSEAVNRLLDVGTQPRSIQHRNHFSLEIKNKLIELRECILK